MKFDLTHKLKILVLLVCGFMFTNVVCQTNEIGVFVGGSLFKGDIGAHSNEYILFNSQPALGFQFKRNLNYHFGINLTVNRSELYGADKYSSDAFELERNLHFKSKITEFGLMLEFNFRPYMSRDPEHNMSPFIFAGITKFFFNPQAKHPDGTWQNLRSIGTEGQGSDFYPTRRLYDLEGISVPFGIGYKINVYDFLTLNFNLSWRITFTDYIDDVSSTYIDISTLDDFDAKLVDQSNNKFNPGFQRGDPNNNDKYGFVGLTILYSIQDPKKDCNNIVY